MFDLQKSDTVKCPICRTDLTKKDFKSKPKEEIEYKTDIEHRRKICRMFACFSNFLHDFPNPLFVSYNKRPEDFKDIKEYNDYLEKLEDIIQDHIKDLYTDASLKEYENTYRTEIKHNTAFLA